MTRPARLEAAQVLRALKQEVRTWILRISALPRSDARQVGHLEALRHVATVIGNLERRTRQRQPRSARP